MPRNAHGKLPDLYPEILQRLRQEIAAKTAHEQAASAAIVTAKTQQEIQPSTASTQNPDPPQISQQKSKDKKERPAMPATVTTHAKAALRSKARTGAVSPSDGTTESESSFERHSRKCTICNHPDREAIEELFINWHSPQSIRGLFAIYHPFDWSAVYRHARAVGLYAKRSKNLRAVLEHLLEGVTRVPPTAHGVIAAVRAYSCLTEGNRWVEPERRVHIVNEIYRHDLLTPNASPNPSVASPPEPSTAPAPNQSSVGAIPDPIARANSSGHACSSLACPERSRRVTSHSPLLSNRQPAKLESPPTHT